MNPLAGITVADLSVTIPGPYCTSLLLRLGARVIAFEPPGGDPTRTGRLHTQLCAGKQSVAVNLKDPSDVAFVRRVVAKSDVLVEGWRPGVAARLGVGPEDMLALNERLVYCSISGYGADGPLRDRAGHDVNYVAMSGMARVLFGDAPPQNLQLPIADLAGGTFAALRVLGALVGRATTGRGCFVDASLGGAVREWVEAIGGTQSPQPVASIVSLPHYGIFETKDGHWLTLGSVAEDHFWRGLCGALECDGLASLSFAERAERGAELRRVLETSIAQRRRAELEKRLEGVDTCWAFADASTEPSLIGGMIEPAAADAPALGEHGPAIRAEFGT